MNTPPKVNLNKWRAANSGRPGKPIFWFVTRDKGDGSPLPEYLTTQTGKIREFRSAVTAKKERDKLNEDVPETTTHYKIVCDKPLPAVSHTAYQETWEKVEEYVQFCLSQGVKPKNLTVSEVQETPFPAFCIEDIASAIQIA